MLKGWKFPSRIKKNNFQPHPVYRCVFSKFQLLVLHHLKRLNTWPPGPNFRPKSFDPPTLTEFHRLFHSKARKTVNFLEIGTTDLILAMSFMLKNYFFITDFYNVFSHYDVINNQKPTFRLYDVINYS